MAQLASPYGAISHLHLAPMVDVPRDLEIMEIMF